MIALTFYKKATNVKAKQFQVFSDPVWHFRVGENAEKDGWKHVRAVSQWHIFPSVTVESTSFERKCIQRFQQYSHWIVRFFLYSARWADVRTSGALLWWPRTKAPPSLRLRIAHMKPDGGFFGNNCTHIIRNNSFNKDRGHNASSMSPDLPDVTWHSKAYLTFPKALRDLLNLLHGLQVWRHLNSTRQRIKWDSQIRKL